MILRSVSKPPIVWSIAGSDCSGGAGLQTDLKTVSALGGHACTVVTAVTAQNSFSVSHVEPVSEAAVTHQLIALQNDLPPRAIKIGMVASRVNIRLLSKMLRDFRAQNVRPKVVCDPVLASSSGKPLLDCDALAHFQRELAPLIDVLTPNIPEAEAMTGLKIRSYCDVEVAARALLELGTGTVVIKGGHKFSEAGPENEVCQDLMVNAEQTSWLTSPRQKDLHARGTGCTFSSAFATALALDFNELDSFVIAKTYINQCLRNASSLGSGAMLLGHDNWDPEPEDFPWLTNEALNGCTRRKYPDCGPTPLGFYPVVNRVEWLQKLLPLGVTTAQLRVKDLEGEKLESEIRSAIQLAREVGCRLFINDYWQLAIKHGAYGVHLGQEDLASADLVAIERAGLRLGLSTHCFSEVARAHANRPSYMAIGPIFPTTLKSMRFAPQGVEAFGQWRKLLSYPLVAIGGVSLESAEDLISLGADGIAVVSDITKSVDPESRTKAWLNRMRFQEDLQLRKS